MISVRKKFIVIILVSLIRVEKVLKRLLDNVNRVSITFRTAVTLIENKCI